MDIINQIGFKKLSLDEQKQLNSAGFLKDIIPLVTSILKNTGGVSPIFSIGSSIAQIIQQSKLIEKIKTTTKGEVEIGKDGQLKIKWDDNGINNSPHNTIIF